MVWLWTVVVIVGIASVIGQRRTFILQYLFFLRHPILLAVALLCLPLTALKATGAPFKNLFVLNHPVDLTIVTALALLTAWVVMYTAALIWTRVAVRAGLNFWKERQSQALQQGSWSENEIPKRLRGVAGPLVLGLLLAAPVVVACYAFAPSHMDPARFLIPEFCTSPRIFRPLS